jgi:hypothetical protein
MKVSWLSLFQSLLWRMGFNMPSAGRRTAYPHRHLSRLSTLHAPVAQGVTKT